MELLTVTEDTVEQFLPDTPELIWSTGPISYVCHFGTRELFGAIALGFWRAARVSDGDESPVAELEIVEH